MTLNIAVGQSYRLRCGGRVDVRPHRRQHAEYPIVWHWHGFPDAGENCTKTGKFHTNVEEHPFDIIAPWEDAPALSPSPAVPLARDMTMRDAAATT